jgi:hypothetical protein
LLIRPLSPFSRCSWKAESGNIKNLILISPTRAGAATSGRLVPAAPSSAAALLRGCRQGLRSIRSRPMRLEEGAHMAQRELDLLQARLPRIDADLRIGRETRALQRHYVGVRRHVVRQHEDRRPAELRTKSRVTVNTKSVLLWYILSRQALAFYGDSLFVPVRLRNSE